MTIYHYDRTTFEYVGIGEADESPLEPGVYLIPGYATTIAPPTTSTNQVAIFNETTKTWAIESDYRNQIACDIDSNGFYLQQHIFVIGETPSSAIILTNIPSTTIYRPKWDSVNLLWIQGATPPIQQPDELTVLKNKVITMEDAINFILLNY